MASEPQRMVDEGVGRVIRLFREDQSLTQGDLAKRLADLGWSPGPTGVAKIEAGRRSLRVTELHLVAQALGVRPFELLGDDDAEVTRTLDRLVRYAVEAREKLSTVLGHSARIRSLGNDKSGCEILRRAGLDSEHLTQELEERITAAVSSVGPIELWERKPEKVPEVEEHARRVVAIICEGVFTVDSDPLPRETADAIRELGEVVVYGGDPRAEKVLLATNRRLVDLGRPMLGDDPGPSPADLKDAVDFVADAAGVDREVAEAYVRWARA